MQGFHQQTQRKQRSQRQGQENYSYEQGRNPRSNYSYHNQWGYNESYQPYSQHYQSNYSYYDPPYLSQQYHQGYYYNQQSYPTTERYSHNTYEGYRGYHSNQNQTIYSPYHGPQWPSEPSSNHRQTVNQVPYQPGKHMGVAVRDIREDASKNLWVNRNAYISGSVPNNQSSSRPPKPFKKQLQRAVQEDDLSYSYNESSFDSQLDMGQCKVGRYGLGNKPKKSKKKESKCPPPQPKTKEPSLVEEAALDCFQTVKQEEVGFQTCPFNEAHIMPAKRLLTHIERCKLKSQNAKYYKMCRYNPCHYFRFDQIEAHNLVCADKGKFDISDDWDKLAILEQEDRPNEAEEVDHASVVSTKPTIKAKSQSEKRAFQNFLIDEF